MRSRGPRTGHERVTGQAGRIGAAGPRGEVKPAPDRAAPARNPARNSDEISLPPVQPTGERNGPGGPEPTRFGDWEKGGRCFDF
ncbi:MAG: DUF1674 domain-containing protein [Geminicoccaceae bacterium]|nr:DUF1674 domain-containing protein [Geminicoccaceae bacterium]